MSKKLFVTGTFINVPVNRQLVLYMFPFASIFKPDKKNISDVLEVGLDYHHQMQKLTIRHSSKEKSPLG